MKMMTKLMCMAFGALGITAAAMATPGNIVISQVYGGGGNTGAQVHNDFIEIFNRSAVAQSLNGWSVQYISATNTGTGSWAVTALTNVTLQPGQYYLIQEAAGTGAGAALPTPDATGTIAMSATAGKVALVNNITALTGQFATGTGAGIVDFVGFGTTANGFEGTGPTPAPSNTSAVFRGGGGCTDTDVNSADFTTGVPSPRNTATALHNCNATATGACCDNLGGCTSVTAATCTGTYQGDNTLCSPTPCVATVGACCAVNGTCTLTAASGCQSGGSSFYGLGVSCAAASPPCVTQLGACCNTNDGSCTSTVSSSCAAGNTFQGAGTVCTPTPCPQPSGACCTSNAVSATCTIDLASNCTANNFLGLNTTCSTGICHPPTIVVSQFYGGGGAGTGAPTYKQDYVELFNRSNASVDVSGWTIQYASAAGTSWSKCTPIPASTSIPAGGYYLIQFNQSGTPVGGDLMGADFTPSSALSMSATTGKFGVVRNSSTLTTGCPATGALVADFLGYGGADCFEGTVGPAPSTTTALFRALGGCQDTNDNAADFTAATPAPRNSATAVNNCAAPNGKCCAPAGTCIFDIQANCAVGSTWTTGGTCTPNTCPQPPSGVCCRGATCTNTIATSALCTASLVGGQAAGASFPSAASCNATGVANTPCCYADYDHNGAIAVADIFAFLADWFAGSPFANTGGTGSPAALAVQNIFDFLADWFAGGC